MAKNELAFTLSEFLIALAIVGVIAAMTLPNLIQKNYEKTTVQKLTKVYSLLSQAYLTAVEENGSVSSWGLKGRDRAVYKEGMKATNANIIRNNLKNAFKISKICECQKEGNCGFKSKRYRDNTPYYYAETCTSSAFLTIDGIAYRFIANGGDSDTDRGSGALKETYGLITVDINGNKGYNTYGKDVFTFNLTNSGIVPQGTPEENMQKTAFPYCFTLGSGCAAWVIKNKNMDYLHCKSLSWNGKHSCSEK